jgi:glucosyl-dolichyl phosphate glucuronosyltransferase
VTRLLAYSIIICTCNRAGILAECLKAVFADACSVPERGEILVVDNASGDRTQDVVAELRCAAAFGNPIVRYAFEPAPGLARARNRGVDETTGAILAFIDDDAIVHSGWLLSCLDAFASRPDAAALGGEILPRSAAAFPDWFRPPLTKVYSVMSLGEQPDKTSRLGGGRNRLCSAPLRVRPYPGEEHPLGANMAFRREVFASRRFSLRLGRTSRDLMGSEETEIFFALRRQGRAILYVPGMRVDHEIAAERLSESWVVRRYWFDGVCRARLGFGWRQSTKDAALMAAKLSWLAVLRPWLRKPFDRLLSRCRMAKCLGFFSEGARAIAPALLLRFARRPSSLSEVAAESAPGSTRGG